MRNKEVAVMLKEIGDLLDIDEVKWEPRAFRVASQTVEGLGEDIEQVAIEDRLEELPGIGSAISAIIKEYLKKGRVKKLTDLRKKVPVKVNELMPIEGLGPKRIKLLYKKLKVKNRKDLEKAAKAGKIAKIKGLGTKVEQNILEAIGFVKTTGRRTLYAHTLPVALDMIAHIKKKATVSRIEYAGSLRRGKSTIGDVDILVTAKDARQVMDAVTAYDEVKKVLATGKTKTSVILDSGIQVDVRVLAKDQFGAGLLYFTGNKMHNITMRKLAITKGLKISEYGIFKGDRCIASKTEKECFKAVGLPYIPPELRQNNGEIEAAKQKKLPMLIEAKDLQGDLHMHTTASDGTASILEMAEAVKASGLKYCVITDHVGRLHIANALDDKRLSAHIKAIRKANEKMKGFTILAGAEVDIDENGELEIDSANAKKLDVIIGSLHRGTKQSKEKITNRICTALENEHMHILGHPTGRLLNKRPSYTFDVDKVFKLAKTTKTVLEIDSQPRRWDLPTSMIRKAKEMGIKMSISSDAHAIDQLRYLKQGVVHARRGWAEKSDIINTRTASQLKKILK